MNIVVIAWGNNMVEISSLGITSIHHANSSHLHSNDQQSFMRTVAKRVSQIRLSKGFTQEELCSAMNMNRSQLARIESGDQNITLLTLHRISKALQVDPRELFG